MGEMTIRNIDDGLLVELRTLAEQRGVGVDLLAAELLESALRSHSGGRSAGARAILAAQSRSAKRDSVDLLREDRARR